jgi:diacylglycerol kinase (ATP)
VTPPPRPAAIFLNEGAGAGRSPRTLRAVELARRALDADLHVVATRDAEELSAWMRERAPGYRTVVVAGGDGSLSVAYNVLAGGDVVIGYLPAGFGNATSHLLRLPRDPAGLSEVLRAGEARPVDLVAVDGRLALFAGAGWDALVAERYAAAGAHRLMGWTSAILRSLPDLARRPLVEVEADGHPAYTGPMELLVVGTTPWYGRGLLVNPGARPDRGRLTARVYPGPLPYLALEATRWLAHRITPIRPIVAEAVVVRRADGQPLAVQADGDVVGRRPEWQFALRPAAVRLIGRW